ncbi:hypothetical protein KKG58_00925 [Patescibacteria group bacterium]|nr:hypothetical protein [Patescibacteria group bacterium]
MEKDSLIRTIYLYAFALLGLIFLCISGIRFLDMGLKAFVFTKAEEQMKIDYARPVTPYSYEKIKGLETGEVSLTNDEMAEIRQITQEYENWEERSEKVDPVTSNRHRTASSSLAMILVGLPLYLYHWSVIKRETKA